MAEEKNKQSRNGEDFAIICDVFERRRALRRQSSDGDYDPNKKSESLFGRRIDDFKHLMHKDDLKKLYPNADSASPKQLVTISTADPSDGTGLFMIETAEPTPTSMVGLTLTQRSCSAPTSKASGQSMDFSGFGSSSTVIRFKICNENKALGMEGTMSCAAPASQTLSVHSKSEEGTELAPHFKVLEKKLMSYQSTFGTVDQECTALESENVIPSSSSSHITTSLDTDKPPEERVESLFKETGLETFQQNFPAESNAKMKVSCTPEVELDIQSVPSVCSKEERNGRLAVAQGINKYPISTKAAGHKDTTRECLCTIC